MPGEEPRFLLADGTEWGGITRLLNSVRLFDEVEVSSTPQPVVLDIAIAPGHLFAETFGERFPVKLVTITGDVWFEEQRYRLSRWALKDDGVDDIVAHYAEASFEVGTPQGEDVTSRLMIVHDPRAFDFSVRIETDHA